MWWDKGGLMLGIGSGLMLGVEMRYRLPDSHVPPVGEPERTRRIEPGCEPLAELRPRGVSFKVGVFLYAYM